MSFKTQISQKIVSIVFSVLVVCFGIGFYVFAWTEPPAPPPGGNVPPPLNIGSTGQTKLGGLILNTSALPAENGLIVAQGKVGIGTVAPQAALDVSSTASGFLPPRMTTVQRNNISFSAESMIIYNTTKDQLEIYDSTGNWQPLGKFPAPNLDTGWLILSSGSFTFDGEKYTLNFSDFTNTLGTDESKFFVDVQYKNPNMSWSGNMGISEFGLNTFGYIDTCWRNLTSTSISFDKIDDVNLTAASYQVRIRIWDYSN